MRETAPETAQALIAFDRTGTPVRLTPTQSRVMHGVHLGQLNRQIAQDLGIAEATVKVHMTALMRKLKVSNRTQVALVAHQFPRPVA